MGAGEETLKHVQTSIMIQILMEITIHSLCHHLSHVLTSCKHKSNLSSLKYCKYFKMEFGSFSAESRPTCTTVHTETLGNWNK